MPNILKFLANSPWRMELDLVVAMEGPISDSTYNNPGTAML